MDAREVKDALRRRHPAVVEGQPGPWTCLEEWMNIDLLAIASWSSVRPYPQYARVGYEVKVSRADYRRELVKPSKRHRAVSFCHEFYFAIPFGLLKPDEIAWTPPDGFADSGPPFVPMRCPGAFGAYCTDGKITLGRGPLRSRYGNHRYFGDTDWVDGRARRDALRDTYAYVYRAECPTCRGEGSLAPCPAERAGAPKLWVPADVGLLHVREDGKTTIVKKAPRRDPRQSPPFESGLGDKELADLIRWVSVRPDPRHDELRDRRENYGVIGSARMLVRAADRIARGVAQHVDVGLLNARSEPADALLDYADLDDHREALGLHPFDAKPGT